MLGTSQHTARAEEGLLQRPEAVECVGQAHALAVLPRDAPLGENLGGAAKGVEVRLCCGVSLVYAQPRGCVYTQVC